MRTVDLMMESDYPTEIEAIFESSGCKWFAWRFEANRDEGRYGIRYSSDLATPRCDFTTNYPAMESDDL